MGYQYDALNRMTNVIDNGLTGTKNTAYTYDGVGNLQTVAYPNSLTNLYQYDTLNRLTSLVWKTNGTTMASFTYVLGLAGNRTSLTETVNSASRGYVWQYDAVYKLTNETISGTAPTGTITNGYDAVGNRSIRSVSGGLSLTNQSFTFNSNDWANSDSYDNNGNTTSSASIAYQYRLCQPTDQRKQRRCCHHVWRGRKSDQESGRWHDHTVPGGDSESERVSAGRGGIHRQQPDLVESVQLTA